MRPAAPPARAGLGLRRLVVLSGARGIAAILGLAGVLLAARALTPEQLGHWSLALAVQGYALHAGEFGLRSVVTIEAGRAGALLPLLLRRYLGLRLGLSLATLVILTGASLLLRPQDAWLIGLVSLSILPMALQLDWLALTDGRAGLAAALLLLRPALFVGLVATWGTGPTPLVLAACLLVSWSIAAAASWTTLWRVTTRRVGNVPDATTMLRRGATLAMVTLSNQAQLSADLLVVGWTLGAARAGDYYLGSQILVAALLFANAAGQLALARLPALVREHELFLRCVLAEMGQLAWLAIGLALGLALLAPYLLPRLFGSVHGEAVTALLCLLPWFVLQHPTTLLQAALAAAGRERCVLRANLVLLPILILGLAMATAGATLAAFAAARAVAELARLTLLGLATWRPAAGEARRAYDAAR